ncbi:MAG: hypothetical protein ACK5KQ_06025 [Anaerorhabdus sp.]
MRKFYMNSKSHEVHKSDCRYCNPETQKYLGEFKFPYLAVREGKKTYDDADGCKNCCPRSNKG